MRRNITDRIDQVGLSFARMGRQELEEFTDGISGVVISALERHISDRALIDRIREDMANGIQAWADKTKPVRGKGGAV